MPLGTSDFETLAPIPVLVLNSTVIRLFTSNDEITLEYDDSVILTFTPNNAAIISGLEGLGEYIRDTATVDKDSKCCISVLVALNLFSHHRVGD